MLVCDGDVETVVGVTYVDDLLERSLSGAPLDLRSSLVEPLCVPTTRPVLRLFESFQRSRHKAAVILDEYSGVAGVVTLEDIMEALVGELPQHGAPTSPEVVRQPDGSSWWTLAPRSMNWRRCSMSMRAPPPSAVA